MTAAETITPEAWTGVEIRALRHALRLDERAFADQLGVPRRHVIKWENAGASGKPAPAFQHALDRLLSIATDDVAVRYRGLTTGTHRRIVRTCEGATVLVEPTGRDEVQVTVYPRGLNQYAGESLSLNRRKAGMLAVALLDAADAR